VTTIGRRFRGQEGLSSLVRYLKRLIIYVRMKGGKEEMRKQMSRFFLVLVACIVLTIPKMALADNYARDYTTGPPGMVGILLYNFGLTGDTVYADGDKVNKNMDLDLDVYLFRAITFFELGGWLMEPEIIIPWQTGEIDNNMPGDARMEMSVTGMGDPFICWVFYPPGFWGQNDLWLFYCPFIHFPIGNYDNHGQFSAMSTNRWQFKNEVGLVKAWEVMPGHKTYFDLTLGGIFYTDNNDWGPDRETNERDPLYTVESHISYDITKSFWMALDYYYYNGAEEEVHGTTVTEKTDTHQVGVTAGFWLLQNLQLLAQYREDVEVEDGLAVKQFNLRMFYCFDWPSMMGGPPEPGKN